MLPFGGSFLLTLDSLFSVVLLSYCTTVLPPYFLLLGFFSFLYPLENSSRKIHFAPLSGFFYQFSQSAGKERDFIPIGQRKGTIEKSGSPWHPNGSNVSKCARRLTRLPRTLNSKRSLRRTRLIQWDTRLIQCKKLICLSMMASEADHRMTSTVGRRNSTSAKAH